MPNMPSPMMNPGQGRGMPQGMPQGMGMGTPKMGAVPDLASMDTSGPEGMEQEPTNILAHMTPQEVAMLDQMMGQVVIDPETGLRDYTMLEFILKQPEVQNYMATTLGWNEKEAKPGFAEGGFVADEQINEPGRPKIPELEELRELGRGEDTELVIITTELEKIFSEMNGGKTRVNPNTGFPEYGFFHELVRVVAGVAGFVVGGPIGAAVGTGLATKATGGSWGQAFKNAAFAGGAGMGAGALGFGGVGAAGFGGMGTAGGIAQNLGFGSAMGAGAGTGAGLMPGVMAPGVAGAAGGAGAAAAPAAAAPSFLSSLGGAKTLLPLAGAAFLTMKGSQDEKKQMAEYQRKQREEDERARQMFGFNKPFKVGQPYEMIENPEKQTPEEIRSGVIKPFYIHKPNFSESLQGHKEGGPITGMGSGQQDNIPKNVKKNSYIIDASTVSDIGDGSTQAGFHALNQYFSKMPKHESQGMSRGGTIKALVSDGEYEVDPEIVTAIGKGSNDKGAKILARLVKEVRDQKRTTGKKLPPKAKSIGGYIHEMQGI